MLYDNNIKLIFQFGVSEFLKYTLTTSTALFTEDVANGSGN